MKPLIAVLGLNGFILAMMYFEAYGPGGNSAARGVTVFAPFVQAVVNLCLGLLCVVAMLVLRRIDKAAAAIAEKFMQAFVIAFGVIFAFGIPACFYTLSHL